MRNLKTILKSLVVFALVAAHCSPARAQGTVKMSTVEVYVGTTNSTIEEGAAVMVAGVSFEMELKGIGGGSDTLDVEVRDGEPIRVSPAPRFAPASDTEGSWYIIIDRPAWATKAVVSSDEDNFEEVWGEYDVTDSVGCIFWGRATITFYSGESCDSCSTGNCDKAGSNSVTTPGAQPPTIRRGMDGGPGSFHLPLPIEGGCCDLGGTSEQIYAFYHVDDLSEGLEPPQTSSLAPSRISVFAGDGVWRYPEDSVPVTQAMVGRTVYIVDISAANQLHWKVYQVGEEFQPPSGSGPITIEMIGDSENGFVEVSKTSFVKNSAEDHELTITYNRGGLDWNSWKLGQDVAQVAGNLEITGNSIEVLGGINEKTELEVSGEGTASVPYRHEWVTKREDENGELTVAKRAVHTVGSGATETVVAAERGGALVREFGYDNDGVLLWSKDIDGDWRYFSWESGIARTFEPYGDTEFPSGMPEDEGQSQADDGIRIVKTDNGETSYYVGTVLTGEGKDDYSEKTEVSSSPDVPSVFRGKLLYAARNEDWAVIYCYTRGDYTPGQGSTLGSFSSNSSGHYLMTIREKGDFSGAPTFTEDVEPDENDAEIGGGFTGGDRPLEREVTIHDPQGRLIVRSHEVFNGNDYESATSTIWEYGQEVINSGIWSQSMTETRDGRVVRNYDVAAIPGLVTTTEQGEDGSTVVTVSDGLGRVAEQTRNGPLGPIVTSYEYDGLTTKTLVNGVLVSQNTRDLRGRTISSTDEAGVTTSYAYNDADRTTTVSRTGHILKITRYRDGRSRTTELNGVQTDEYIYSIETGSGIEGYELTTRISGPENSPRYAKTLRDLEGRTQEVRTPPVPEPDGSPGQGDDVVVEYEYNEATGGVSEISSNVSGIKQVTESDLFGYSVARGVKLTSDSNDFDFYDSHRYSVDTRSFEKNGGYWWEVTEREAFVKSDGSSVTLSSARRLWSGDGKKSVHTDVSGNETAVTRTYDRTNAEMTVATVDTRLGTTMEVYHHGYLISREVPEASRDVEFGYDAFGRTIRQTNVRGATTRTVYNGMGQVEATIDPLNRETSYIYYPYNHVSAGRLHQVVDADGKMTSYTYDAEGRVTEVDGDTAHKVTFGYDDWGGLHTMTTYGTVTATTTWDRDPATGLLTEKRYAGQAADSGVRYAYHDDGSLESRIWSRGNKTVYSYNAWGDLAGVDYKLADGTPDSSTPDVDFLDQDLLGRYTTVKEYRGSGTDVTTLSHKSVTSEAGLDYAAAHSLLPAVELIRFTPDLLGRDQGYLVKKGGGEVESAYYGYDTLSRLSTIRDLDDGAGDDGVVYQYHPGTSVVRHITQSAAGNEIRKETRNVDLAGGLVGVVTRNPNAGNLVAFSSGYVLDELGRRTTARREDGSYWEYGYNDRSEVVSGQKHLADGSLAPGMKFEYGYDGIGNRDWAKIDGGTGVEVFRLTDYTPDALNQYDSITHPDSFDVLARSAEDVVFSVGQNVMPDESVGAFHRAEVTADNSSHGKWVTVEAESEWPVDTMVTQNGSHWLAPATELPSYDDDGNLETDGRWTYTWDGENRLITMVVSAAAVAGGHPYLKLRFHYDWQGRRIGKTVYGGTAQNPTHESTRRWLYEGWNPVVEFTATAETGGTLTHSADYVWGIDLSGSRQGAGGVGGLLEIARQNGTGSPDRYFPAYDGNGNVIGWMGDNGAALQRLDYDPFGNLLTRESSTGNEQLRLPFGFSTKYQDGETGLLYYGYRYYDPVAGRWPSRDPIGENGGLNLYAMSFNNPIKYHDVLGLEPGCEGKGDLGKKKLVLDNTFKGTSSDGGKPHDDALKGNKELLDAINNFSNLQAAGGLITGAAQGVGRGVARGAAGAAQPVPSNATGGVPGPKSPHSGFIDKISGVYQDQGENGARGGMISFEYRCCKCECSGIGYWKSYDFECGETKYKGYSFDGETGGIAGDNHAGFLLPTNEIGDEHLKAATRAFLDSNPCDVDE